MVSSNVSDIMNSRFVANGNTDLRLGAAIYIIDSTVTVRNNTFQNNIAIDGGAVYFGCTNNKNCDLNLINDTFLENTALKKGGAIYYDYVRPTMSGIVFQYNVAQYGKNIASYPVKIRMYDNVDDSMSIRTVGSGITYEQTLRFGLYDYDNQIMVLDSSNQIIISPVNTQTSSIGGINNGLLYQGVATFDSISFIATPGSPSVAYTATSRAINSNIIQDVFGSAISESLIDVNFRF